jgi:hypothetical protein
MLVLKIYIVRLHVLVLVGGLVLLERVKFVGWRSGRLQTRLQWVKRDFVLKHAMGFTNAAGFFVIVRIAGARLKL